MPGGDLHPKPVHVRSQVPSRIRGGDGVHATFLLPGGGRDQPDALPDRPPLPLPGHVRPASVPAGVLRVVRGQGAVRPVPARPLLPGGEPVGPLPGGLLLPARLVGAGPVPGRQTLPSRIDSTGSVPRRFLLPLRCDGPGRLPRGQRLRKGLSGAEALRGRLRVPAGLGEAVVVRVRGGVPGRRVGAGQGVPAGVLLPGGCGEGGAVRRRRLLPRRGHVRADAVPGGHHVAGRGREGWAVHQAAAAAAAPRGWEAAHPMTGAERHRRPLLLPLPKPGQSILCALNLSPSQRWLPKRTLAGRFGP